MHNQYNNNTSKYYRDVLTIVMDAWLLAGEVEVGAVDPGTAVH